MQDGTCPQEFEELGTLGPIENAEVLVRVVRSPEHLTKKKELKPSLFPLSHIRKTGVSVTRSGKMPIKELVSYVRAVAEMKDGQQLYGLRSATAGQIRDIKLVGDRRALCVIEDPAFDIPNVPDNPAHAIAIASIGDIQEDTIIEIQLALIKIFKEHELHSAD